ncbi:MAG TPA: 30S ribosomal protein S17 [Candidatus Omnitrophota bacterium]|nr:30S ribosomal protein S17 [Candidatus Omnitrophota bacterium]
MSEVEEKIESKRIREGMVVSHKMNKTITVLVTRLLQHTKFKKVIKRHIKYAVHDEKNEAKEGDRVQIVETRPLSKTKRWRLVKVIKS